MAVYPSDLARFTMSPTLLDQQCRQENIEASLAVDENPARKYPGKRRSYLTFGILASLYLLPFMRVLLPWSNEGTLASGAVRIIHGQVFSRDFFEVMGPGTFYCLAAFFKVFGVSFVAMRFYLFLTSIGTAMAMYFLARRLCVRYHTVPCIILGAAYYGLQWPGISHHVDSNCFALLSVVCAVVWHDRRWKILLFAAGVLAGITTSIHQPKGALLLVAILVWLLIECRRESKPFSLIGYPLAGYLGVGAFVLAWFWCQGALGTLYDANVVWPSLHYEAVNRVPYALGIFHEYWSHWLIPGANWSYGMAAVLITPFLFIAALPAILIVLCVVSWPKAIPSNFILYLLCGVALWLSEFHRRDIYHLVFGSPLFIIIFVYLLNEIRKKSASYVLQLLTVAATCLATLNLFVVATAHAKETRVGQVAMYKDNAALVYLDAHTVPGEEIFAYPYCPIYYFLSATNNPTRFLTLTYNYNPTSEFQSAIDILEQRKVRFVVWDTNFLAKAAPVVFSKAALNPPTGFIMEDYLSTHYRVVKDANGVEILERIAK